MPVKLRERDRDADQRGSPRRSAGARSAGACRPRARCPQRSAGVAHGARRGRRGRRASRATSATSDRDARVDPGAVPRRWRCSIRGQHGRASSPRRRPARRPRHAARLRAAGAAAAAALRERAGVDVGATAARAAIRAEIAYYRAHCTRARDAASLADLRGAARRRCGRAAGRSPTDTLLGRAAGRAALPRLPRQRAGAARAARDAGSALVVVSNWDWSLHERLHETGLAPLVDGALASAEVGVGQAGRRDLRAPRSSSPARRRRGVARRRHAGGRRRGRARGRPAPDADRARRAAPRRTACRGPIAGRAHTLGRRRDDRRCSRPAADPPPRAPEPAPPPCRCGCRSLRCWSPCWSSSACSASRSIGVVAAADPSFKARRPAGRLTLGAHGLPGRRASSSPPGSRVKLALGHAAPAEFGLRRVRRVWRARSAGRRARATSASS